MKGQKQLEMAKGIGYKISNYFQYSCIVTNYNGNLGDVGFTEISNMDKRRYHIDHFDADLIRDIASVRTGDVWVKGEPFVNIHTGVYGFGWIDSSAGENVEAHNNWRRPTIAEICDHHGYKLNGMNIVKKSFATGGTITSKKKIIVSEYDK